jgi:hypothetical protein
MSTSISGSGPAYIFMLMEAMVDAGVHMGFSRENASTLVNQTILGSTLYAIETGEHPAILRNMVTSPAGTTASAIYELENGKFRVVIKDVSTVLLLSKGCIIETWYLIGTLHSRLDFLVIYVGNLGVLPKILGDGRPAIWCRSWKTDGGNKGYHSPPLPRRRDQR